MLSSRPSVARAKAAALVSFRRELNEALDKVARTRANTRAHRAAKAEILARGREVSQLLRSAIGPSRRGNIPAVANVHARLVQAGPRFAIAATAVP